MPKLHLLPSLHALSLGLTILNGVVETAVVVVRYSGGDTAVETPNHQTVVGGDCVSVKRKERVLGRLCLCKDRALRS